MHGRDFSHSDIGNDVAPDSALQMRHELVHIWYLESRTTTPYDKANFLSTERGADARTR